MGDITYLGTCKGNNLREAADMADQGDITHAVVAYRTEGGELKYRLIGEEDLTYLIGLLERTKVHMHCSAAYVIPGGEGE